MLLLVACCCFLCVACCVVCCVLLVFSAWCLVLGVWWCLVFVCLSSLLLCLPFLLLLILLVVIVRVIPGRIPTSFMQKLGKKLTSSGWNTNHKSKRFDRDLVAKDIINLLKSSSMPIARTFPDCNFSAWLNLPCCTPWQVILRSTICPRHSGGLLRGACGLTKPCKTSIEFQNRLVVDLNKLLSFRGCYESLFSPNFVGNHPIRNDRPSV